MSRGGIRWSSFPNQLQRATGATWGAGDQRGALRRRAPRENPGARLGSALRQRYNRSVGFTPAAFIGPVLGVIIWATIYVAATGRLGRNQWIGIRTAATGASDQAWLAGHRAALRPAQAGLLALLLLSFPAWILPRHPDVQTTCTVLITLVTIADLIAVTVASTRGSRRTR